MDGWQTLNWQAGVGAACFGFKRADLTPPFYPSMVPPAANFSSCSSVSGYRRTSRTSAADYPD